MPVDSSIVATLKELPPKHRSHLLKVHAAKITSTLNKEGKIERLAQLIGPNHIHEYTNLYLSGNGGLVTWYVFKDADFNDDDLTTDDLTLSAIARRLNRKFKGIETGIFPELDEDTPPQVHRLRRIGKSLMIELAAMDQHKHFYRNWQQFDEPVDHIYRIVVRDDPLTLEIRAAYGKIETIYQVVSDAIGLRLGDGTRCALDARRIKRLKRRLGARAKQSVYTHHDSEISRSSLESQPLTDLEAVDAHSVRLKEPGVSEFSRVYICTMLHPDDFPEEVRYQVNLGTGQIRVRNGTSEFGVNVLRKHVVELF